MYYIYVHTNNFNGKKYIGMTNNVKRRWRQNGSEYKGCKVFSRQLKNMVLITSRMKL